MRIFRERLVIKRGDFLIVVNWRFFVLLGNKENFFVYI